MLLHYYSVELQCSPDYVHFWGEDMVLECGSPISQIMVILRLMLGVFELIKNSLVTYMHRYTEASPTDSVSGWVKPSMSFHGVTWLANPNS